MVSSHCLCRALCTYPTPKCKPSCSVPGTCQRAWNEMPDMLERLAEDCFFHCDCKVRKFEHDRAFWNKTARRVIESEMRSRTGSRTRLTVPRRAAIAKVFRRWLSWPHFMFHCVVLLAACVLCTIVRALVVAMAWNDTLNGKAGGIHLKNPRRYDTKVANGKGITTHYELH
jgi:hypothetical protein